MTCCHPIHSGVASNPSRHFRNAFCEYERNDMKAAIKRTLSIQKGICSHAAPSQRFGQARHRRQPGGQLGEMLVHRLRGGGPDRVGVLPNLRGDIEQRDHDRESADDLSEIGEVVEILVSQLVVVGQALRLPKSKMATDRSPYDFSWRSSSAASKWPFDSAISPSLSIFQSS